MKVILEFPDSILDIFNISEDKFPAELKTQIALFLYEKGKISFGKARELSGLTVWEIMEKLKENNIPIRYDIEEFKEDLKIIKDL